jgi:hypothetical protein
MTIKSEEIGGKMQIIFIFTKGKARAYHACAFFGVKINWLFYSPRAIRTARSASGIPYP